jgi:nuclear transport factor 2 (NTF2) superfamily protein
MAAPATATDRGHAIIAEIMRVWNGPDRDGILASYSDDAVIEMPGAVRVEGRAAITAWLDDRLAQLGEFSTVKHYRASEGDYVCVEYETTFRSGGEQVRVRGAEVYRLDAADRICEQRQYNYVVAPDAAPMDLARARGER